MFFRCDYYRRRGRRGCHIGLLLLIESIDLDYPIVNLILFIKTKNNLIHFIADLKKELLLCV